MRGAHGRRCFKHLVRRCVLCMAPFIATSAPSPKSRSRCCPRRRSGDLENAAPSAQSSGVARFGFKKRTASTRSQAEQATRSLGSSSDGKRKKAAGPSSDFSTAPAAKEAAPILQNIKVAADKYGKRVRKATNLTAPWRKQTWQQSAVELHYSNNM